MEITALTNADLKTSSAHFLLLLLLHRVQFAAGSHGN